MEEMEWIRTKVPMVAVTACNTTEPAASATAYGCMNVHTVQAILSTEHTNVGLAHARLITSNLQ